MWDPAELMLYQCPPLSSHIIGAQLGGLHHQPEKRRQGDGAAHRAQACVRKARVRLRPFERLAW